MFRRLIATWLIVSILGYGVALAADVHGEQSGESGYSQQDRAPAQDQHTDSDCGHCSHGVTHLLGLGSDLTSAPLVLNQRFQADYLASLLSPPLRRHLRPPISV